MLMNSNENQELSTTQPGNVTNYVPEGQSPSVEITPKRSLVAILVWTVLIGAIVFVWMRYQNESNVRESEQRLHESEIEQLKDFHEKELASREEVFEARLQQEHEKGFVADYIQPWIDWFRGSEIEAEIETPGGVGGRVKLKPGTDN